MLTVRRLLVLAVVPALVACGLVGVRAPATRPDSVPMLPADVRPALAAEAAVPPSPVATPAPAVAAAAAPTAPRPAATLPPGIPLAPESGIGGLNTRLLSQVSPPAGETDLPIGPGDLIEVAVFEVEELSKLKLRVPMRGTVTLPLLGPVPAAGRTAIELEDEIRQRLRQKYMHDPQVSVFVHEHNSQRISVIGAVRRGGVFTLSRPFRLADALALAEGLTDDASHVIYVIRRVAAGTAVRSLVGVAPSSSVPPLPGQASEEVMVPIDLEALAGGREELNVALQSGDVIQVPRAGSVYVGGSVDKPGSYVLRPRMTVHQAILTAGGAKDVADLEDIRLYRVGPGGQREVQSFSLKAFEQGEPAPELTRNDVVVVGKSGSKAFWYGFLDVFKGIFGLSKGF